MTHIQKGLALAGMIYAGWMLISQGTPAYAGSVPLQFDGGPFGPVVFFGGADGLLYAQTGTSDRANRSILGNQAFGANFGNAEIGLKSTQGIVRFNIVAAVYGGTSALGVKFGTANLYTYRMVPIKNAFITLAPPGSPVTVSVGQVPSVEGYEGQGDLGNANIFASNLWYVENASSPGISATYTQGRFSGTVTFGDGWNTHVYNFLQAAASYALGDQQNLNLYYTENLGHTGVDALTYAHCGDTRCTVGRFGSNFINSRMIGGYDIVTLENLKLTPEVQYVFAPQDRAVGVDKFTADFGAVVHMDYSFENSPFSLGGMVEYFDSSGDGTWFIGPRAEGIGLEVTPTWRSRPLFVRFSTGYVHLLNAPGTAYGNYGTGKDVVQFALETGVTF